MFIVTRRSSSEHDDRPVVEFSCKTLLNLQEFISNYPGSISKLTIYKATKLTGS